MRNILFTCITCLVLYPSFSQIQNPVVAISEVESNLATSFWRGAGNYLQAAYQQSLLPPDGQSIRFMEGQFISTLELTEASEWLSGGLKIQSAKLSHNRLRDVRIRMHATYARRLVDVGSWRHYLSMGVSAAWNQQSRQMGDYWFALQYDLENQQIDRSLSSGEGGILSSGDGFDYINLAFGLSWLAMNSDAFSWSAGIAAYNFGTFGLGQEYRHHLDRQRWTYTLNSNWKVSSDLRLIAGLQYEDHLPYKEFLLRLSALSTTTGLFNQSWFQLGMGTRFSNHVDGFGWTAMNIFAKFQVNRMGVGLIYEFPLGSLARYPQSYGNLGIALMVRPGNENPLHWY